MPCTVDATLHFILANFYSMNSGLVSVSSVPFARTVVADGQDLGLGAAAGAPEAEHCAAHQQPQPEDAAAHALPVWPFAPGRRP